MIKKYISCISKLIRMEKTENLAQDKTDNYNNNNKYNNNRRFGNGRRNNLSHFINIPIEDDNFIEKFQQLRNQMQTVTIKDFDYELLQKPGKIHMTICVLNLETKEAIELVNNTLTKLQPQLKQIADSKLKFEFEKYETMGNSKKTRVIYAKMQEDENYDKIMKIVDLIIRNLIEVGVLDKKSLSTNHVTYDKSKDRYGITLHMTLFNVTFLNKILKKKRKGTIYSFDATEILKYLSDKQLPSADIKDIHLSEMKENKKTEKYEMIYNYNLI